jgi:tetratricopeptide (TPR) repeat protein
MHFGRLSGLAGRYNRRVGKLQQQPDQLNDADALRAILNGLEKAEGRLSRANIVDILTQFAQAREMLMHQETAGTDVRSELSRYEDIGARLERDATNVVRLVGGANRYRALRAELGVDEAEGGGWQLDEIAARRARRVLIVGGSTLAAFLFMLGLGYVFRETLFPVDPIRDAVSAAQAAAQKRNPAVALSAIDTGLAFSPTNATLLVWQGAMLPMTRSAESTAAYGQARAALGETNFLLERSQVWLAAQEYDKALLDLNGVIAARPKDPIPYYLRASAYEGLPERKAAIADLEKAAELSQLAGNDYLYANARIRLGYLMQQISP